MTRVVLDTLVAQSQNDPPESANLLVGVAAVMLVAALYSMRRVMEPLHEIVRMLATAALTIILVVAALVLVVGSLLITH